MLASAPTSRPIRLFIDGECPLCKREGAMLMRMDRGRGLIALEDIAAPTFDPARWGLTHDQVQGAIHAELPDGRVITGLEVFRRAYGVLSPVWGTLWRVTGWPVIRVGFDAGYRWFARNRIRIGGWFGRHPDPQCESGRCKIG
ncbi:MAG: thiol-disulfide oxidoreductase DCC family protein [Phycisphaerales bacterium]